MLALNVRFRKTPLFDFRYNKKDIYRILLNEVTDKIRMNKLVDAKNLKCSCHTSLVIKG